jgi:hypothetical protein
MNVGRYQAVNIQNAIKTVQALLEEDGMKLRSKAERPMPQGYRPEVDVSDELPPALVTRYQNLIGILRWACELGRIDIVVEVSMLSSHTAMPRVGHLEAIYHIFAYLRLHENSTLVSMMIYLTSMTDVF